MGTLMQTSTPFLMLQLLLLLAQHTSATTPAPVVQASWGRVQGVVVEGDGGRKMNGYLGIPYALPPVGELRFQRPQEHPGMAGDELFVADQVMDPCPQVPLLISAKQKTSEDCLKLDVYVPQAEDSGPYSVMVFIHGGGFTMGDAPFYRPSKLVQDGQVIVVIIQYRLGSLGFFSSGDGLIKGNQGLWDQRLALQWVQNNIRAFGGDPGSVTIFGESAGSMSVGSHILSKQSRGLFRRAIMQSGSPLMFDTVNSTEREKVFKDLARLFDCQGDVSSELLACMRKPTGEEFFNKTMQYVFAKPLEGLFFPYPDGEFLPTNIEAALQDEQYVEESGLGEVDIMQGFNNQEGAMAAMLLIILQQPMEKLNTLPFFSTMLHGCTQICGLYHNAAVIKAIEFYYRGADAGTDSPVPTKAVTDMYGDCLMNAQIFDLARLLSAPTQTRGNRNYMYVMDHDFAFNSDGPVPGAHHGDELLLEFDIERELAEDLIIRALNKTKLAEDEKELSDTFVQMVTMFAKTGNPSAPFQEAIGGEWPQFNPDTQTYLSISKSPRLETNSGPYRDRTALWRRLLPQLSTLTADLPKEEPPQQGQQQEQEQQQQELQGKDEL